MSEQSADMGRRIRSRRTEIGLTQEQVALACSITKSTVSRYENGTIANPHRPTVEAIAKVLRVSPDWLYGLQKKPQAAPEPAADVRRIIEGTKARLMEQQGLMFDGTPVSAEALQSILDAMDVGMTLASQRQKQKK